MGLRVMTSGAFTRNGVLMEIMRNEIYRNQSRSKHVTRLHPRYVLEFKILQHSFFERAGRANASEIQCTGRVTTCCPKASQRLRHRDVLD